MKRPHFVFLLFICLAAIDCLAQKFSFVFFTDVHMNQSVAAEEGFTTAVEQINNLSPDFAIQGGDFIFDMNHEEWDSVLPDIKKYNQVISELKCPVYNVLGNHDVVGVSKRSSLKPGDAHYNKAFFLEKNQNNTYYTFNYKGVTFFVLDCIQFTKSNFTDYYIDTLQQNWIAKQLELLPKSSPIVIVSHVPFISLAAQIKSGGLARNSSAAVLSNGKDILKLFKEHELKLFLAGHLHRYEKIETEGVTYVTGGAVSGKWWKGPMGKTPQGFVFVEVDEADHFSVTYTQFWE